MTLDGSGQVNLQAEPAQDRTSWPPTAGCTTPGQLQSPCLPVVLLGITHIHNTQRKHTKYTHNAHTPHTQHLDMAHNTHRHTHNTHIQHTDMTHNTRNTHNTHTQHRKDTHTHTTHIHTHTQNTHRHTHLSVQSPSDHFHKAELSTGPSALPDPIDKDESRAL
jgi:hypothetical protein